MRCRMVIGGASACRLGTANHGKWRVTGSSSCSAPASRSWRIDVAVKSLVIEAMR